MFGGEAEGNDSGTSVFAHESAPMNSLSQIIVLVILHAMFISLRQRKRGLVPER